MICRKKPIKVTAFRLGYETKPRWFLNRYYSGEIKIFEEVSKPEHYHSDGEMIIETSGATYRATRGDFIIEDDLGIYVVPASKFDNMFDDVGESFKFSKKLCKKFDEWTKSLNDTPYMGHAEELMEMCYNYAENRNINITI